HGRRAGHRPRTLPRRPCRGSEYHRHPPARRLRTKARPRRNLRPVDPPPPAQGTPRILQPVTKFFATESTEPRHREHRAQSSNPLTRQRALRDLCVRALCPLWPPPKLLTSNFKRLTWMSSAPFIPDSAPFTAEQRAWLNGFLAGMFSRSGSPSAASAAAPAAELAPLTILWGSQTGTAEGLAKQAAKEAGKRGFAPTILDMAATTAEQLATAGNVLVITSTYGDGEPPDNAKALHTALLNGAPSLAGVRYAVCGLGDTHYTLFNQCAKDFDAAIAKHGGARVHDRADCDTDYEAPFTTWLDQSLAALGSGPAPAIAHQPSSIPHETGYSKKNPFPAPLLTVRNLNAPGSAKEVNHVEFSLDGSGLTYEAGDALAVIPQNCPELVAAILTALGSDGEEAVTTPAGEVSLRLALTAHLDLGKPTKDLLALLDVSAESLPPKGADVLDALNAAATKPSPAAFAAALKKLAPRLYSISSSPKAHP